MKRPVRRRLRSWADQGGRTRCAMLESLDFFPVNEEKSLSGLIRAEASSALGSGSVAHPRDPYRERNIWGGQ